MYVHNGFHRKTGRKEQGADGCGLSSVFIVSLAVYSVCITVFCLAHTSWYTHLVSGTQKEISLGLTLQSDSLQKVAPKRRKATRNRLKTTAHRPRPDHARKQIENRPEDTQQNESVAVIERYNTSLGGEEILLRASVDRLNGPLEEDDPVEQYKATFSAFLEGIKNVYSTMEDPTPVNVWNAYYDLAMKHLIPIDEKNKGKLPYELRDDGSIFISLASYRDVRCPNTLEEIFSKAEHPERIRVGVVQQNCADGDCQAFRTMPPQAWEDLLRQKQAEHKKKNAELPAGKRKPYQKPQRPKERVTTEGDPDCRATFCASGTPAARAHCRRVDQFGMDYALAMGPCPARYFASKLWRGETYFMQVDSHLILNKHFDTHLIRNIHEAPFPTPVLSTYPVGADFRKWETKTGARICRGRFSKIGVPSLTWSQPWDDARPEPKYGTFIAAGFFMARADFLAQIPFDPLLPWVFVGEEIHLSLRFWTHGMDIIAPDWNYVAHFYGRGDQPKFYEVAKKLFAHGGSGTQNAAQNLVSRRVMHGLHVGQCASKDGGGGRRAEAGECAVEDLPVPTLAEGLDGLYGLGTQRDWRTYYKMTRLDRENQIALDIDWCQKGETPEEAKPFMVQKSKKQKGLFDFM